MKKRSIAVEIGSRARGHAAVLLFGPAGLMGKIILLPPPLIVLGRVVFAGIALAFLGGLRPHGIA